MDEKSSSQPPLSKQSSSFNLLVADVKTGISDTTWFRDWDWITANGFQCIKEFVAVLFQLVCYSRMGNYDFFNGALVLLLTLVVFDFPFLNSNLFTCLRFGPWFLPSKQNFVGTLIQTVCIALFQVAGACAAAAMWFEIVDQWKSLDKAVDNGILYNNETIFHGAVYNNLRSDVKDAPSVAKLSIFLDEFAAQLVFLVGLIHIMEAVLPGLLMSAAWQSPPPVEEKPSSSIKHMPIPLTFILCASMLVAAVTRAFPSAHQSPHISIFLLMLGKLQLDKNETTGIDTDACWLRLAGGLVAVPVTLLYYWFVYVSRDASEGEGRVKTFKRAVFDSGAPYMRSELLLPGIFKSDLKPL